MSISVQGVVAMPRIRKVNGVRSGRQGVCTACGEEISAHVGPSGWLGCVGAKRSQTLILIPERRSAARTMQRKTDSPMTRASGPRVVYVVHESVQESGAPAIESERDKGIFQVIAKSKTGLTAWEIATKMGLETTRGIIESSLQRLRYNRYIGAKKLTS